jgi:hypothetical protein
MKVKKMKKKSQEEFVAELSKRNQEIEVLGKYTGSKDPIKVRCTTCGNEWNPQAGSLLRGSGCPNYYRHPGGVTKRKKRTPEQFVSEMQIINPDIEILGEYERATERVTVKCLKCSNVWAPKAYSLLSGKGCPICAAKRGAVNNKGLTGLKSIEQFVSELKAVDKFIEVVGAYVNTHTDIKLHCLRCGHDWFAKPYSLLQGHGCPRCAKSGTSFMEQFILLSFREVLGKDAVLSRDKSLIGMELDIYIPELNFAIEPGNWLLHQKSLKRDELKRQKCLEKDVCLITVYDKFPKGQTVPFDKNIYTFECDLNRSERSIIKNLVLELFSRAEIEVEHFPLDWKKIEKESYEHSKSLTHEIFVKRLAFINQDIEVIGFYQNANKRLRVKCKVCGYEWDGVPASLLSGDGCRKCGAKKAHMHTIKSQLTFEKEVAAVNPDVEIIGVYTGRHSKVKTRCKICGYEWEPKASSLLHGGSHKGAVSMHRDLKRKVSN